jgi:hypothetical protein
MPEEVNGSLQPCAAPSVAMPSMSSTVAATLATLALRASPNPL